MPEQHVAHVADARVGDQALQVLLAQREQRAVDDADRRRASRARCRSPRRVCGMIVTQDAQDAVAAHLQQHAGEDHGDGRRRVGVRVGQPRVQREHRQLHGEGDEDEAEDHPAAAAAPSLIVLCWQLHHVERVHRFGAEPHDEEADEHERRAGDRVQHELHRRVLFAAAAPDGDEHVHREQLDLPEEEEHDQVERREDAEHARLEGEQPDEVLLRAQLDAERDQRRDDEEERREQHHRDAEAVDAQVELDVEAGRAASIHVACDRELEGAVGIAGAAVEADEQHDRATSRTTSSVAASASHFAWSSLSRGTVKQDDGRPRRPGRRREDEQSVHRATSPAARASGTTRRPGRRSRRVP